MKIVIGFVLILYWGLGYSTDLLPLLTEQQKLQEVPLSVRVENLEKRLSNKTLLNMLSGTEAIKKEFQQLKGEVESLSHEIENIKKRQRALYLDLDQRIIKLEGTESSDEGAEYSSLMAPPDQSVEKPKKTTRGLKKVTAGERKVYDHAYQTLQDGDYTSSIGLFTAFLEKYPDGEFADNAEYWRAEAYYVGREFEQAKSGFRRILDQYPDSSKAKDGLLKIGFIEYEQKNWVASKKLLNEVLERYPDSTVSKLATERLNRIRKQGH